jgi:hypothetical protein
MGSDDPKGKTIEYLYCIIFKNELFNARFFVIESFTYSFKIQIFASVQILKCFSGFQRSHAKNEKNF